MSALAIPLFFTLCAGTSIVVILHSTRAGFRHARAIINELAAIDARGGA